MTRRALPALLPLLVCAAALQGCFLLVVGGAGAEGGYIASQQARTPAQTAADQWIHAKVTSSFIAHAKVKKRDINVDVFKGTVTLKGRVESADERDAAVSLARAIEGVKGVVDRLKVGD